MVVPMSPTIMIKYSELLLKVGITVSCKASSQSGLPKNAEMG